MILRELQSSLREVGSGPDRWILLLLFLFLLSIPFSIFAAQVGYFGALIIWVGTMAVRRESDGVRTGFEMFFLLYLAAELISTLLSSNTAQSFLYMQRRMLLIPILYLLLAKVKSRSAITALLSMMLLAALGVALWSFRDLFINFSGYLAFQRRLSEFQMYMTAGGIMMIVALVIIPFVLHRETPTRFRWTAVLVLVPVLVNLLFTFTRSSWLGLIGGALVIGLRRHRKVLLPLLVILGMVVALSSPEMKDRMSSAFDPSHPNNVSRVHMWEVGWGMFLDHPLFGIGDIGTEQLWDRYSEPGWPSEGHLHNNVIMWMVTLGLTGSLVLISLFVALWRRLWEIEKLVHQDWLLGSLLLGGLGVMTGFHINGMFEWNFGDAEIMMLLWSVTGLSLAAGRMTEGDGK
ncbi:MAG: O-antigen ligase family protein [Ignavibacteria bacterium]|nr:O-antigen ligase family protein [Ignavibacteria bacterium]